MDNETTSEEFFEDKYRAQADPWSFASSPYEQARYSAIIQSLAGRRFKRAFEPGCSIGILTERLAPLCDALEAMDISRTAVATARERCLPFGNVTVRHGALPHDIPAGAFDLILFSEIGYYFDPSALRALGANLVNAMPPLGVFLAAHWLGHSPDHLLTGNEVHQILGSLSGLHPLASHLERDFRIDLWSKA